MTKFLILLLTFISTSVQAAPAVSNGEAIKIIEKAWTNDNSTVLLIGNLKIFRDRFGGSRAITQSFFDTYYSPLIKLGWVDVVQLRAPTMLEVGVEGIANIVDVRLTAAGLKKQLATDDPSTFAFLMKEMNVSKVIGNDEIVKGVDVFRTVRVVAHVVWQNPVFKSWYKTCGLEASDWKAIVLLKFDPFSGDWKLWRSDYSGLEGDFCTTNVQNILK